jgi:hypothetical protein
MVRFKTKLKFGCFKRQSPISAKFILPLAAAVEHD